MLILNSSVGDWWSRIVSLILEEVSTEIVEEKPLCIESLSSVNAEVNERYTNDFKTLHNQISTGVGSGDREGHAISQSQSIAVSLSNTLNSCRFIVDITMRCEDCLIRSEIVEQPLRGAFNSCYSPLGK
ncbi:hypothetical protein TNCV_895261 [Trichonephila clavipes]|nr:hypothetical protein TNCV_895261 [Trichonephila clavipes]